MPPRMKSKIIARDWADYYCVRCRRHTAGGKQFVWTKLISEDQSNKSTAVCLEGSKT